MYNSMRVRELNDAFRKTFIGGRPMWSKGIDALPDRVKMRVLISLQEFDNFSTKNDPHGEHDFGSFEVEGHKVFFKIDYYNRTLDGGSIDPSDPLQTTRVLTIMLAEEY